MNKQSTLGATACLSLDRDVPIKGRSYTFEKAEVYSDLKNKRIAVVHDWLPLYGGAERVLEQILNMVPHADLYTIMEALGPGERGFLHGKQPHTSLIQKLPFCARSYRNYFAFMPFAVEQFDLSSYDIIISSSYAFAKGVLTGPNQLHVCYCHSPIRFAWDMQHQYLAKNNPVSGAIARMLFHYIRLWDTRTSNGVNAFIANSKFIARRIEKTYRRHASVIYPPVAIDDFSVCAEKEDYYVTASRFVPYKRLDLVVEAFSRMPDKKLVVIGDGPDFAKIKQRATPNIKLMGHQPKEVLRRTLEKARAFVFAGEEDFGIALVEAQACGTPVIALGRGGALETVLPGETGVLFPEQTASGLIDGVSEFERSCFDPGRIRLNVERFSIARFQRQFLEKLQAENARFHR
jgi:glycosyltransferase involved in cell wall biosynthesis